MYFLRGESVLCEIGPPVAGHQGAAGFQRVLAAASQQAHVIAAEEAAQFAQHDEVEAVGLRIPGESLAVDPPNTRGRATRRLLSKTRSCNGRLDCLTNASTRAVQRPKQREGGCRVRD